MNKPFAGFLPLSAFALAFSLLAAPFSQSFAEEAIVAEQPAQLEIIPVGQSELKEAEKPVLEAVVPEESSAKSVAPQAAVTSLSAGDEGESEGLAAISNAAKAKPEMAGSTGALSYRFPVEVPPGRNGLAPSLSLAYNSQNSKEGSFVGYGWSLDIPFIERKNVHGANALFSSDDFTSSEAGDLNNVSSGVYGPKTDDGSFLKFNFVGNSWVVKDKKGTTYSYGTTAQARQDDPADVGRVAKWMIEKIEDTNGNFVSFSYYKNQGQIYPDGITYANTAAGNGIFSVTFARETRNDLIQDASVGFMVTTAYRISQIQTFVNGTWARKYILGYVEQPPIKRSLLASITESGQSNGVVTTMPAATFDYDQSQQGGWVYDSSWSLPTDQYSIDTGYNCTVNGIPCPLNATSAYSGLIKMDVNGDGLTDIIQNQNPTYSTTQPCISNPSACPPDLGAHKYVYLNNGHGWTWASNWFWPEDHSMFDSGDNCTVGGGVFCPLKITSDMLMDVNGDGLPDAIQSVSTTYTTDQYCVQNPSLCTNGPRTNKYIYINNGSGWHYDSSWQLPADQYGIDTQSGCTINEQPCPINPSVIQGVIFTMDVNGDGLVDFIQSISHNQSTDSYCASNPSACPNGAQKRKYVYLNTGHGWTLSNSWAWPANQSEIELNNGCTIGGQPCPLNIMVGTGVIVFDVNGDGLPDLVQSNRAISDYMCSVNYNCPAGPWQGKFIYLNTGSGWAYDSSWQLPADQYNVDAVATQGPCTVNGAQCFVSLTSSTTARPLANVFPADVNGDGLIDIVQSGAAKYSTTQPCVSDPSTCPPDLGARKYVYLNNGHGWVLFNDWTWPADQNQMVESPGSCVINDGKPCPLSVINDMVFDANGDGLQDMVQSGLAYSDQYCNANPSTCAVWGWPTTHNYFYLNTGHQPLLKTVNLPTGGSYAATYKPSTQYVDGGGNLLNQKPQFPVLTVNTLATNDGNGTIGTISYSYAGGSYYYDDPFDKKFAGFETVTQTNPDGSKTITRYHQGNATDAAAYEYDDHVSKIGKPYRVDKTDAAGNLYSRSTTKFEKTALSTGRYFAYPVQTIDEQYDGNATHADKAQSYVWDTATGNLSSSTEWGSVTATTPLAFVDAGADQRTTSYSYATNAVTNVTVPSVMTVTDAAAAKVREEKKYYDDLPNGSVDKGNQTKSENWITASSYASTLRAYDGYGMAISETDPRGKVTNYSYDAYHLYPATVTDPLGHATSYLYDYASGKAKQTTDQNGLVYQTSYDGFGRALEQKQPDLAAPATLVTKTTFAYVDAANAASVKKTDYLDATNGVETYRYFDGLGRAVQERREAETAGNFAVKDTLYDAMGRTWKESLPYFSGGSARTSPTAVIALYGVNSYDPLQRVVSAANAVGTTAYAYDDLKTTITDANGKQKNYYKDAYGNLVTVEELNAGTTYVTSYQWDANQKLTKITDALGNVRNFAYDGLGRRVSAEDLHAVADASFGIWAYAYDDAGNLVQSIDPKAQTVQYSYDDANRVTVENYTGAAGNEITYAYDACTKGVGKLCSVIVASGPIATNYSYDALGGIAAETKDIIGTSFTTFYSYDRQGNALFITAPDSAQIKNTFNAAGLLDKIDRKESGGPFVGVVSNIDYSPLGQIATMAYANGVTTTNSYDAAQLYRLASRVTAKGANPKLQNQAYSYDAVGNITKIIDTAATNAAKTVDYAYDDLHRLVSATATNAANGQNYAHTFAYDAIGNVTNKSDQGAYLYEGSAGSNWANPHAATSVNGVSYAYDKNGNLLSAGTMTNVWNYNDLLKQSTVAGTAVNYSYDHSGTRVNYQTGSTNRKAPNKYYNVNGTKKAKHIFAGDTLVATIETSGTTVTPYYVHTDTVLGSNVISDAAGAKNQLLDYYAFGGERLNERAGSFNEQRKFGGHERDAATGLDYMGARYYSSAIGRFLSEDPAFKAVGDGSALKGVTGLDEKTYLSNPQLMNSYSYAGNNPLKYVDKKGNFVETVFDVIIVGYDAYALKQSINEGRVWDSIGNTAILALDSLATVLPFIPAAAGEIKMGLNALNAVDNTVDAGRAANIAEKTADLSSSAKKIHGNSLNSPKQTTLYQLRDAVTGEHLKYGITSKEVPEQRYTQEFMKGKIMEKIDVGTRRDMHAKEAETIKNNPRGSLQKNNH